MSKRFQLLFATFAFLLVAAGVYLVVASWNNPGAALDLVAGLLPAIFGGGATSVLAAVVLVFAAMYALLFQRLRRSESLMAAQEAEHRAQEKASPASQPTIIHEREPQSTR